MLKTRIRHRARRAAETEASLASINGSITALQDEDLLDLADIFRSQTETPIAEIAAAEMKKRGITLA
ncbi:hypothetical protein U1708_02910 [Sphingomonas sp. ZB1N12]|uniref:hypothetical protein n=1 Tax=Sphingomonas arabinosi TaxID=3096160 RepID=UPI002FC79E22